MKELLKDLNEAFSQSKKSNSNSMLDSGQVYSNIAGTEKKNAIHKSVLIMTSYLPYHLFAIFIAVLYFIAE